MADDLLNAMLGGSDGDDDGGLSDLLNSAGATPGSAKGAGADALGGLAGMLGGSGGGDLMGMLGALTGGGGDLGGMLTGFLGGGGGADFSQMPVVGPVVNSLSEKFGIPPAQASALVVGALTMLMSQMNRSGASRLDEIDIDEASAGLDQSGLISQAAAESGLDEEQAAAGVQEALQMLAQAAQ